MAAIDWIIVIGYVFLLTAFVMMYARRHITSIDAFLVAGRGMGYYLGIAGIVSAEIGLISVMALAEMGYREGFSALMLGICFSIGVTFVGATGFIICKLRQYKIATIPEFLKIRYGEGFRRFGGLVLGIAGVLNFGVFLRIDSIFFAGISGDISPNTVKLVMGGLLVLALSYTLLAGMVSVLVVNYIQFMVLVVGLLVVTVFSIYHAGWTNMVQMTSQAYGKSGFDPFEGADLGWPFLILNILVFLTVPCLWQPSASLGLSSKNIHVAKRMYLWSGLTFMGRGTIPIIWGIAAFAYFANNKIDLGPDFEPIMALPLFLNRILPAGVKGLIVATMFAAALSTYNAYLLAWSGLLNRNVVTPILNLRQKASLLANRILIVLIGIFLLWWGLFYTPPESFFQYQQLTAAIYLSGTLAVVFLGLYWKKANTIGAFATIILGTVFPVSFVLFSEQIAAGPKCLHFLLNGWKTGITGFVLAFITMIVVSALTCKWCKPIELPQPAGEQIGDVEAG